MILTNRDRLLSGGWRYDAGTRRYRDPDQRRLAGRARGDGAGVLAGLGQREGEAGVAERGRNGQGNDSRNPVV
jgi:hypothetical protein